MDQPTPTRRAGRIIRLATGWVLVAGGIILGPVPILPGFALLLPGLALLATESRFMRGWLRSLRQKRLMRRAMREAERVGFKFDLGQDGEGDEADPPDHGKGSGD